MRNPVLTAPGPDGGFYVATVLAGSRQDIDAYPMAPVNPFDKDLLPRFYDFSRIGVVAAFDSLGGLRSWRTLWSTSTSAAFVPLKLFGGPQGPTIILVNSGASLPDGPTPGAFFPVGGGPMMVGYSPDLRTVRVSTFTGAFNSTLSDAALDSDGNLTFIGETFGEAGTLEAGDHRVTITPFVAKIGANGQPPSRIQPLPLSARGLALAADGGLWLGVDALAGYPLTGLLGRPYTGSNVAQYSPADGQWTSSEHDELSSRLLTILGHPAIPGEFLASTTVSLFRSGDFGANWSMMTDSPPGAIAWSLADPDRLYSWTGFSVATSTDRGMTWRKIAVDQIRNSSLSIASVAVSPTHSGLIAIRTERMTWLLRDGEELFRPIPDPAPTFGPSFLALDAGDAPRLLLAQSDGSISVFTTKGGWEPPVKSNLRVIRDFSFYPGPPAIMAAQGPDFTTWISQDYGHSWTELSACSIEDAPCKLWINPGRGSEWWLTGRGLWRSTDAGATWRAVRKDRVTGPVTSLAFSGTEESPVVASLFPYPDVYLRKLTPAWDRVEFASYLGGSLGESLAALLVDPQGRLNVVTTTNSPDYPVAADALQTQALTPGGGAVGLTRLSPAADSIEYSTLWGGHWGEQLSAVRLTSAGKLLWCGGTYSSVLPAQTGDLDRTTQGCFLRHIFTGGFDPATNSWTPSYVFGENGNSGADDCAMTSQERLVITGRTDTSGLPLVRGAPLKAEIRFGMVPFISIVKP